MKVIDLHCDTLWKIDKEFLDGKQANLLKNDFAIDFERMAMGNVGLQCFALFTIPQNQKPYILLLQIFWSFQLIRHLQRL